MSALKSVYIPLYLCVFYGENGDINELGAIKRKPCNMDSIKIKEEQIQKLIVERDKISNERKRIKMLDQIKKLKFDQETEIMNYLEKKDDLFNKTLNANFDLLENDNIIFAVSKEGGNPFTFYETELQGNIHQNGYLYFETKKTNNFFNPFSSLLYPTKYSGIINYFGETNVIASEKNIKMFGSRVPQKFKGSIDSNGNINFKTIKSYFEFDGHFFVRKIIADPFSGDESKRITFIENRIALKNLITDFRKRINSH